MGGEMRTTLHQRPGLDAMRAQLESAPASLYVNGHELADENVRNIAGIFRHSNLRPKLTALNKIKDASSRPYEWQELSIRKPRELLKADALRGCAQPRTPLYPLPCNSPRMPAKLDALRKQMGSAPASTIGAGSLHSFCHEYKKESSRRPPRLDENALRSIDQKLDAADGSRPAVHCNFSQGIRTSTTRLSHRYPETPCTCDREIRARTHRRHASMNGDKTGATLVSQMLRGASSGEQLAQEDLHPKNYRLRSDMDAIRRRQHTRALSIEPCKCTSQCQEGEKWHKPKKSVNFKDLKDDLKSHYKLQRLGGMAEIGGKNGESQSTFDSRAATNTGVVTDRPQRCKPLFKCDEVCSDKLRKCSATGADEGDSRARVCSDDQGPRSENLEGSQGGSERLDKSLQRQKMILWLIRRNKERQCAVDSSHRPPHSLANQPRVVQQAHS